MNTDRDELRFQLKYNLHKPTGLPIDDNDIPRLAAILDCSVDMLAEIDKEFKDNVSRTAEEILQTLPEAVQTVMRRYGIEEPYEKLKAFTRGKVIDKTNLHAFIDSLALPDSEKKRLKKLTPEAYLGKAIDLAKKITLEIELGLEEE